jgi:hypothetical protein
VVVIAIVVAGANDVFAQGAYVSASLLGDILRSTHADSPGAPDNGGEAIGFAIRAGTPLGAIWGIEVEFAHPGEIEQEFEPGVFSLGQVTTGLFDIPPTGIPSDFAIFDSTSILRPSLLYSVRTSQRNATLGASLWIQQQLSGRIAMVYLGGVGFHRTTFGSEYSFPRLTAGPGVPPNLIVLPPARIETVAYGVRPMVGVEARIEMTRHLHLVPGFRLHAGDGLWLMRPAVGVGWMF